MATNGKSPNSDDDYISSLPDDIITHILSYIPTESVVATSVLSKRWNRVWISVPNLDFGNYDDSTSFDFESLVDLLLTRNNVSCVRNIRLHHYEHPEHSRVNAWISSIARRDAEVIDLKIVSRPIYHLPEVFFIKRSLVVLKLSMIWSCKVPQLVCFPKLKTIHLDSFSFDDDDDSMKNLLFGCPVLENLHIEFSKCCHARTFGICSSTLQVLRLGMTRQKMQNHCYNFVIDTPNLRDFGLVDHIGGSHNIINVSSLVKLRLEFDKNNGMFELLTKLPMFHNLINLTLDILTMKQWESVARLLHRTPNLATFKFVLHNFHGPCVWPNPNEVPHCLLTCIENVEVSIYLDEPRLEEMVSYILKNANVLKKLSIRPWYAGYDTRAKEKKILKTLMTLPRSSNSCQVYYRGAIVNYSSSSSSSSD